MKKILITGGLGFIGFNLAKYIIENKDWYIIVIDSLTSNSSKNNFNNVKKLKAGPRLRIIKQDISKFIFNKFKNFSEIDCIIHLAANLDQTQALKDPNEIFKTNVMGTLNILNFAKTIKAPLIFSSSIKVYSDWLNKLKFNTKGLRYEWINLKGIGEKIAIDKDYGSRGIYGLTKYIGELMCQEYHKLFGNQIIINRKSSIYGYYQYGTSGYGWLWHFIESFIKNKTITIYGTGKQVRDILFIDDLVELYIKQIEYLFKLHPKASILEIYNVGGGYKNSVSLLEVVKILENISSKKINLKFLPSRPSDLNIFICDTSKVSQKFDWKPKIDYNKGIDLLYQHIKKLTGQKSRN